MSELKAIRSGEIYNIIEYEDCYRTDDLYYPKSEADKAIAELKSENAQLKDEIKRLENVRKVHIEGIESMYEGLKLDAKQICKIQRTLWLARAELCHRLDVDRYLRKHRNSWYNENCLTFNEACVAMEVKICKAESKCRAKADEYK